MFFLLDVIGLITTECNGDAQTAVNGCSRTFYETGFTENIVQDKLFAGPPQKP